MRKTQTLRCVLLVTLFGFGSVAVLGAEEKAVTAGEPGRIVATPPLATNRPRLSLDGQWELRYDAGFDFARTNGLKQKWYQRNVTFPKVTQVPGCWHYNTGGSCDVNGSVVWFKKTFTVPAAWSQGRVWLHVGGVKPAADIWFNGAHLGFTRSSRTPIKMDVTDLANRGGENTVAHVRGLHEHPVGRLLGL